MRKKGQLSRVDLVNISGWSKAKVSQEISSMLNKGYLIEKEDGVSKGGRRPKMMGFNQDLGFIIGIDLGATSLDIALTDAVGFILQRESEPSDVHLPPETVLGQCIEIIRRLISKQKCPVDKILGIGIGVPGPVDFSRSVLVAPPLMPNWENFSIRNFFKQAFPTAFVVVDNDVNVMALGEWRYGKAINVDHFIFVKIGTGIGAGIFSNGKIHRGNNGCAGDIGHICIDKNGPICRCGNRGCLEAMAAGPAIVQAGYQAIKENQSDFLAESMKKNNGILTPELISAACREGDEAALNIIRASGQMIGDVLASLVNFFNPSHIFIGGGISNFGNHLLVAIRRAVLRRSLPLATTQLQINFSQSGSDVGIYGVLALVQEHLFVDEKNPFFSK